MFIIIREVKDKEGNVLQTEYYKGYRMIGAQGMTPDGPMFGYDEEHAQRFVLLDNARNLIGGDVRFNDCVARWVPE